MPLARGGDQEVFLYVHVSFLPTPCEVTAGRLYHGGTTCAECCTYTTASKQLGLYASLPCFVPITISTTTWLSLVSRPSISRLDAFSQSFKHFKDGYFKVVVKEEGRSHFLNADESTKFPFS